MFDYSEIEGTYCYLSLDEIIEVLPHIYPVVRQNPAFDVFAARTLEAYINVYIRHYTKQTLGLKFSKKAVYFLSNVASPGFTEISKEELSSYLIPTLKHFYEIKGDK